MQTTRVLIADDQLLFSDSLARVISHDAADMEVVGIAHDGAEAVELAKSRAPHVVLMDVRMPVMDGVEATKRIMEATPSIRVIVLTTFDDDTYVNEAIRNGAVGYLLKDMNLDDLIDYIRMARKGAVLVTNSVMSHIVSDAQLARERNGVPAWANALTPREIEILSLLVEGFENAEIARRVYLGIQTVKNYVSSIYAKIGVHDRAGAVRRVLQDGVVLKSPGDRRDGVENREAGEPG